MNQHQDVLVLLESADEKRTEINQGLLTEGRRIAERFGTSLSALTIGESAGESRFFNALWSWKALLACMGTASLHTAAKSIHGPSPKL